MAGKADNLTATTAAKVAAVAVKSREIVEMYRGIDSQTHILTHPKAIEWNWSVVPPIKPGSVDEF